MAEFYKKKLGNGLTVLFEKRDLPVVCVSASIKFGSAFETEKNKGIAHFIEHLMFKGTKTRAQQEIASEIEKKGGVLNAYTGEEFTSYWNKLPSKHLEIGISIPSDLILNPKFDAVEFEKEKNVIIEEIKMYHDNPSYYVYDKIKEMLYEKPFGMSQIGTAELLKGMNREQLVNLFNSVYTTDEMILCVVGDADFDEICKSAETIYPKTQRKLIDHNPIKKNSELVEKREGVDQAHLILGFHAPSIKDKERYGYEIAGTYLFEGMSSVLWQEIRAKRGLAYNIRGSFDLGRNYGYCAIYVGTLKEKIREVKEIILREIKKLGKMEKRDFDEAKEQLIGMKKLSEEDSSNVMHSLVLEESAGDAEEYYKYEERINSVKIEDVRKLAKIKSFSTFSLIPKI